MGGVCEHSQVRKSTLVILLALGAAFTGWVISSVVRDLRGQAAAAGASVAAAPQTATLHWRETYGRAGQQLVFTVDRVQVLGRGWRAWIGIDNKTTNAYDVGSPNSALDRSYGLMLFPTHSSSDVEQRIRNGTLPPIRKAVSFAPSLPTTLEAGQRWEGTISAPGALVAGSWARVVFGTLAMVGNPPPNTPPTIVWITDHALRLKS